MYDIASFTLKDMALCSAALRPLGSGAASMEEVSGRIVRHLYDNFVDKETGRKAFVLIRFFRTHPYGELSEELRAFARGVLGGQAGSPEMKCLTLLASAGVRPEWQSHESSKGHRAIPLASAGVVERFPMVRQLVQQFGLEVNTVLRPDPGVLLDLAQRTYNVFFIPKALGSQYVTAQEEFVKPFGVESVLGFGGMLPSGNLYAIIMFSAVPIPPETAELFRTLALSVKVAVLPFDSGTIFA